MLDHFSQPQGRFWPNRPSSTISIWKNQLALAHTPEGLRIARTWIEAKIQGRILHLRKLKSYRSSEKAQLLSTAKHNLADILAKIQKVPLLDFNTAAASRSRKAPALCAIPSRLCRQQAAQAH